MKIVFTAVFTILVGFHFSLAQETSSVTINSASKQGKPSAKATIEMSAKGLSPQTAFLLLDIKKSGRELSANDTMLFRKYGLFEKSGKIYVNSFLLVSENFEPSELTNLGVKINTRNGKILTATIPVNAIEQLAKIDGIKMVQIGEKATPTMDSARITTKVNLVHQGTGLPQAYTGNGVVVGIIDIGFDYTHTNFYDATGVNNYRIKRVWEQNATSGTPPSGFSYGRELTTQTAILNAQRDAENQSHGTHVAGIAAGAGGGVNTTYRGVAPQSDLVLVATDGNTVKIMEGIYYIMQYANSVNKPCVINMSWDGHIGPHDGLSAFDQYCDLIVGEGRILVGSAGNSGLDSIYLTKSFSSTDTVLYSFVKFPNTPLTTNGETIIDIWGEPNQDFEVAVNMFNTNTNQFEDWTPYISTNSNATILDTLYDNDITSPDPCYVIVVTEISPLNNKPHATIIIDNTAQDNNYRHALLEIIAKNTQIKSWAATGSAIFSRRGYTGNVVGGSTNSTMGEIGGTGNSIISVGAYTSKNSWTALNSSSQTADFYTVNGAIAPFSSKGPTADGRTKPDITAPGNVITSSVSRFDNNYPLSSNYVVSGVTIGSNDWLFATMQGTSMAAPVVTGIVALWLQANPNLTPAQIKNYLKDSSTTDGFTGSIPSGGSNIWGWGKINAYRGLKGVINAVLPLTLLNFKATLTDRTTLLQWQTTNEQNVKEFIINRSNDGSLWNNLGNIPAQNSTFNNNYSFKDYEPITGVNYYRLQMIDKDGKYTYSPIQTITIKDKLSFVVAPNPADNFTKITFSNPVHQALITITDTHGKKIFSTKFSGSYYYLNTNELSKGVYFISVQTDLIADTQKLFIK